MHDAVSVEPGRLGYKAIHHIAASPDGTADHLTVNVRKIFCDIYAVYDGEVILQVELQRFGEEPVTMEIPAKVTSGLSFAASGEATGESLAQALQTAIRTMLRDFGFSDIANEKRGPQGIPGLFWIDWMIPAIAANEFSTAFDVCKSKPVAHHCLK